MTNELPAPQFVPVTAACDKTRAGLLQLLLKFSINEPGDSEEDHSSVVNPAFTTIEIQSWKEAFALWTSAGLPLLSNLSRRSCPACDSTMSHTVFQSYDGYHFNECEQCGTWYVPLVVDWELFERFFSICPLARDIAKKVSTARLEQLALPDLTRFDNYFRSILDIMPPQRSQLRYLDVGCGVGHSLTAAKTAGMLPHGVEVDPDAVALAQKNHEVVVNHVGDLPDGTYDVVSMWETLEHLTDPLSMLQEVVKRLSQGGLVLVTVPNLDALAIRILREKCSYAYGGYNSPGHINFFNRRTIGKLFEKAGLKLVEASYEFSSNPLELFGYLGGLTATDQPYAVASPPQALTEVLNAVWPAVTLLEEFAGTLPIMHCIACRPEDLPLFSKKRDERAAARRDRLITAAQNQLAPLGASEQQLRELTEQYTKMHDHLQGEVNIRDKMLAELQKQLNERSRR